MYVVTWGWVVSVWWLWLAGLRQSMRRQGAMPSDYGVAVLLGGAVVAVALWLVARWMVRWAGLAPEAQLERREWHHAFWWAAVPNALLLGTVYLMIAGTA